MTALVLDAGFLLRVEKRDRQCAALLKVALERSWSLRSNGAVLAEVWRGGAGGQAPLAALLHAVDVVAVDENLGRVAGTLIRDAGGGTAIDATVVAVADSGDRIVTSDPHVIESLVNASGRVITVVTC